MADFRMWDLLKVPVGCSSSPMCPERRPDLLDPVLVVCSLPLQLLASLPRLFQLGLVQVATATSSRQVLLQLPDGHSHLLQLRVVFLRAGVAEAGQNSREGFRSEENTSTF